MAPATAAAIAAVKLAEGHPQGDAAQTTVVPMPAADLGGPGGEAAAEGDRAPADDEASAAAGEHASPEGEHAGPDGEHAGPDGEHAGPEDGHAGPEDGQAGPGDEQGGAEGEHAGPGSEEEAAAREHAAPAGEAAMASGDGATGAGEAEPSGREQPAGGSDQPAGGSDQSVWAGRPATWGERPAGDGERPQPDGEAAGGAAVAFAGAAASLAPSSGAAPGDTEGPPTDAFVLAEAEPGEPPAGRGPGALREPEDGRAPTDGAAKRESAPLVPPVDLPTADGAVVAAAAVPLAARRVAVAEPQRAVSDSGETIAPVPSPFDLLRAEPPASAAAQADLADAAEAVPIGPSTAAGARGRYPPPPPAHTATIRAPSRATPGVSRTEPVRNPEADAGDAYRRPPRSIASTLRLLAVAVAIVAVLIFIATRLFGSGSPSTTGSHSANNAAQTSHHAASGGPPPQSITVAVLNGTNTSHLASGAWARLEARGYRRGAVANAPSQSLSATSVGYTHGRRSAALEVARDLGLGSGAVAPVAAARLADAARNGRRPQVVVTLGGDYAAR
jgi:hypothetical protein